MGSFGLTGRRCPPRWCTIATTMKRSTLLGLPAVLLAAAGFGAGCDEGKRQAPVTTTAAPAVPTG